jgi:hypothetical protein
MNREIFWPLGAKWRENADRALGYALADRRVP